jgi:hypothetical protein
MVLFSGTSSSPLVVDRNQQKPEILSALFVIYFEMLKIGYQVFKISLIK